MRGTEHLSSQFVSCEAQSQSVWDGWRGTGNAVPASRSLRAWFPVMPLSNAPTVPFVAVFSNQARRDVIVPGSYKVSYADYDSTSRRQR
jgi:hypothetical protein